MSFRATKTDASQCNCLTKTEAVTPSASVFSFCVTTVFLPRQDKSCPCMKSSGWLSASPCPSLHCRWVVISFYEHFHEPQYIYCLSETEKNAWGREVKHIAQPDSMVLRYSCLLLFFACIIYFFASFLKHSYTELIIDHFNAHINNFSIKCP